MMKSFSESSDWYIYDNKENEENFSIGSDTDEDIRLKRNNQVATQSNTSIDNEDGFNCIGKLKAWIEKKILILIKIFSVIVIGLAILTLVLSSIPYKNVKNVHGTFGSYTTGGIRFGVWYTGIPMIISGLMGLSSMNYYGLLTTTLICIITVVIVFATSVVELIGAVEINKLKGCLGESNQYFGSDEYETAAKECLKSYIDEPNMKEAYCYCVGKNSCAEITTTASYRKGCQLIYHYPKQLITSATVVLLSFISSTLFLIFLFKSLEVLWINLRRPTVRIPHSEISWRSFE